MTTLQTNARVQLAIMRQSGLGSPASGAGADGYDVLPSQRMEWNPLTIQNNVVRRDTQSKRNRHGMGYSSASYNFPLRLGSLDKLSEASLRSTYTASFTVLPADVTSITTTTSAIVGASGSFLTKGVKRGMMVQLTNHSTAANNGKWFRVVDVDASHIFVSTGDLIADAGADTTFTITLAKWLTNPTATTVTERYHTVEEVDLDLATKGVLGTDMKVSKMSLNASPTGLIGVGFDFMGLNYASETSAPSLTTPTYATGDDWVMADGVIRIGGVDYSLEGFQFAWDCSGKVPQIMGTTGPDVVLGNGRLSGSFQVLILDNVFRDALRNETIVDFFVTCRKPGGVNPIDFQSYYFGNASIDKNASNIAESGEGVMSINWGAGIDEQGSAHASTTMLISSSAP